MEKYTIQLMSQKYRKVKLNAGKIINDIAVAGYHDTRNIIIRLVGKLLVNDTQPPPLDHFNILAFLSSVLEHNFVHNFGIFLLQNR